MLRVSDGGKDGPDGRRRGPGEQQDGGRESGANGGFASPFAHC
jgi:hypothetical protein